MCYAGCNYEYGVGSDNAGDCTLHGKDIPDDALCVEVEKDIESTFTPTIEDLKEYADMQAKIEREND